MDPATHADHNKPETTTWTPADDFEREHAKEIRERLKGGFLLPSQAVQAVRNQVAQDAGVTAPGQTHEGNLGGRFKADDEFAVKHAGCIRERMRGGLTQAQAVQCVKDQLAQDARNPRNKS